METTQVFAITYGRLEFLDVQDNADGGLNTIFLKSVEEVKDLATQFIQVIPDDLDYYQKIITAWKGKGRLYLGHQDDDTFHFTAVPVKLTTNLKKFHKFVEDYRYSGHEDD